MKTFEVIVHASTIKRYLVDAETHDEAWDDGHELMYDDLRDAGMDDYNVQYIAISPLPTPLSGDTLAE